MTVQPDSRILNQVRQLGRRNAHTLGFFPDGAFDDYAARDSIIAVVEDGKLRAYAAFRMRNLTIILVHLCVTEESRGQGYARALVDQIAESHDMFAGIQAKCRADYPADRVWPHLGFTVRNEIQGRAASRETTLKVWWRDLGLPDLFSSAPADRLVAAVDINVLIDFDTTNPTPQHEESKALLADWLSDVVELVVTDEVYIEIDRNPRKTERRRRWQIVDGFRTLPTADNSRVEQQVNELEAILGKAASAQEISDRRHLAKSILASADFFVTRDTELLASQSPIEERWGISIVRPSELIARTDTELSERSFAPTRLAGSELSTRSLRHRDIDALAPVFQAVGRRERKGPFVGALRRALANPDSCSATLVTDTNDEPLGLLVQEVQANSLDVLLLRTGEGPLSGVLARHLLWVAVRRGVQDHLRTTRMKDDFLSPAARSALAGLGFRNAPRGFTKLNAYAYSTAELAHELASLDQEEPGEQGWLGEVAAMLRPPSSPLAPSVALELEKAFWPAKLFDTELPSFIIPIHPAWAGELFHESLARQSLFGATPSLMLRLENAYYRAAHPGGLKAPSRVLWYVTASTERPSSKCIAASSLIYEVVLGPAEELYSRFKRYGVFRWQDVLSVAKGDPDERIMAFRFGHTEVFDWPVPLNKARTMAADAGVKHLVLQSPFSIPSNVFDAIYTEGIPGR